MQKWKQDLWKHWPGKASKKVSNSRKVTLWPFFSVKTHKEDKPFRVIVGDKETWQNQLARYSKAHLSVLPVDDPLGIDSSQKVIELFEKSSPVACFSVDVKDMFYNFLQCAAIKWQHWCLWQHESSSANWSTRFSGLAMKVVMCGIWRNRRLCAKSWNNYRVLIAFLLYNLFMAKGEYVFKHNMEDMGAVGCFRNVHDFLPFFFSLQDKVEHFRAL